MLQRVMLRFYVDNFLCHNAETFRRGTLLCYFRNFLVAKKFMDKREGGVSRFSVEVFCLTMPKHIVEEPSVLCFRKIPLAKMFMDKREGDVSRFSFEIFLSHSAEKIRRATI